jgi:hypothetical protein
MALSPLVTRSRLEPQCLRPNDPLIEITCASFAPQRNLSPEIALHPKNRKTPILTDVINAKL